MHQRYSTNTFPTWDLAQPFRYVAHNGEINTLRGNVNWMHAREGTLASELFGPDLKRLFPIVRPGGSDPPSSTTRWSRWCWHLRSLAPGHDDDAGARGVDGHQHHGDEDRAWPTSITACSGAVGRSPASMAFTDGRKIGALLDRNGLRPSRYTVTKDGSW